MFNSPYSRRSAPRAFTLVELLVVIAIIGILTAIVIASQGKVRRVAKRAECMSNLRQFTMADIMYKNEHREFPPVNPIVPSTMTKDRLQITADYFGLTLPPGPVTQWPKRPDLPRWMTCPLARDSGYAEGLTVGGGIYTGYIYVGGVEESVMVQSGMAQIVNPGYAADKRGMNRGVLWADILNEFIGGGERRFEIFHHDPTQKYPDFRFHEREVEGIHRCWTDGAVEWVPGSKLNLSGASSNLQIRHVLGNFYY